jgi:O-antigen/teichoic acid export membrane protein
VSGIIAARALGVEDRGHLALLVLLPIIFTTVGLAVPVSATYYIARETAAAGAIVRVLARPAAIQLLVLSALHVVALIVLLSGSSSAVRSAALITVPAVPVLLIQQYGLAILQGRRRFGAFNLLRTLPAATYTATLVIALATGIAGLVEVTSIWMGAFAVTAAVTITVALRGLPNAQPKEQIPPRREMLRFAGRAWLGTTSPSDQFQLDQAVAGLFISPGTLGLYVAGLAFTNLPRFIGQSIGQIAYPTVTETPVGDQRRVMWRFFLIAVIVSGAVVVALELSVATLLPFLFGEDFKDAIPLARILLVGGLLVSARRALIEAARGAGYAGMGSIAELASLVTLPLAIGLLAPTLGINGVALAVPVAAGVALAVLCAGIFLRGRGRAHQASRLWMRVRARAGAG